MEKQKRRKERGPFFNFSFVLLFFFSSSFYCIKNKIY